MDIALLNKIKNNKTKLIDHKNTENQMNLSINSWKKIKTYRTKVLKVRIAQENHFQIAIVIINHNRSIEIVFAEEQQIDKSQFYTQNRYSRSNSQNNQYQNKYSRSNSNRSNYSNHNKNRSYSNSRNNYCSKDRSRNSCNNQNWNYSNNRNRNYSNKRNRSLNNRSQHFQ